MGQEACHGLPAGHGATEEMLPRRGFERPIGVSPGLERAYTDFSVFCCDAVWRTCEEGDSASLRRSVQGSNLLVEASLSEWPKVAHAVSRGSLQARIETACSLCIGPREGSQHIGARKSSREKQRCCLGMVPTHLASVHRQPDRTLSIRSRTAPLHRSALYSDGTSL